MSGAMSCYLTCLEINFTDANSKGFLHGLNEFGENSNIGQNLYQKLQWLNDLMA